MLRKCKVQRITVVIERLLEVEGVGEQQLEVDPKDQAQLDSLFTINDLGANVTSIKSEIDDSQSIDWEVPPYGDDPCPRITSTEIMEARDKDKFE